MRPSVVSDGDDDADMDDQVPGATSLSAAVNALAGGAGARRQVRLVVPVGGSTAVGGGRPGVDDDRRGCRATLSERSLFIFSEENFIRKYAKIIIEWGYPLCRTH